MKIFNIYPVKNQDMYAHEDYAMILAHLLEQGKYDPKYLNNQFRIIMDNGVYENAKVSNSINALVDLANKSNIIIDEIVIPDVIGDYEASKKLYEDNYKDMLASRDDYSFMYVVHASNMKELKEAIAMANDEHYLDLVLGIPKRCKFDRTSPEAIALYKTCRVPIHFLGIRESFEELLKVKDVIRSCDSVQLCYLTRDCDEDTPNLLLQRRQDPVIDLDIEQADPWKLSKMRSKLYLELSSNGLL